MKKLLWLFPLAIIMALTMGLFAPYGFDSWSVSSTTASGLPFTSVSRSDVTSANVTNIGTTLIYFRIDGGTPTSTIGDTIYPGAGEVLQSNAEVVNFKSISATGTGQLVVTYFHFQ